MPEKLVRFEPTKASQAGEAGGPTWTPTPQAKQQATTFRVIAVVLWVLAIADELFSISWVLQLASIDTVLIGAGELFYIFVMLTKPYHSVHMLLIEPIVVIGVLAVVGELLWKRANNLDPASRSDPVRFFIQNQLGAILGIAAFLPLIIFREAELVTDNQHGDSPKPPAMAPRPIFGWISVVGPLFVLFVAAVYAVFGPLTGRSGSFCGSPSPRLMLAGETGVMGGEAMMLLALLAWGVAKARREPRVRFGCLAGPVLGGLAILAGVTSYALGFLGCL